MSHYQGKHHDGRSIYDGRKSVRNGGKKATATERKKYVAPTANHHDVLCTSGTTKDAAEFKDTVQILARHVSTASGWKQCRTLAKAMTDLAAPVYQTGETDQVIQADPEGFLNSSKCQYS